MKTLSILLGMLAWILSCSVFGKELHIAVAANFGETSESLASLFEKRTGVKILISKGSTAKLYTQIKHGAPFAVFLAADEEHPGKLVKDKLASADSLYLYALGKLVLWSPKKGLVDKQGQVLATGRFNHLAIANPKLAPYGRAAQEVLESIALGEKLQPRLVYGENIAQAFQFVATANAELGMLALSQLIESGKLKLGSYWLVSAELYRPIRQAAVLLKQANDNQAARQFMDFLKSETARAVIEKNGYAVPSTKDNK